MNISIDLPSGGAAPRYVLLLSLSLLVACGGDGEGGSGSSAASSSTAADTGAPTAEIVFPPAGSLAGKDSIVVRGTARDPEGSDIVVVRVNGVDATTTDEFANWTATVPLEAGENTLTVETGDIATNSNSSAATVTVHRDQWRVYGSKIVFDHAGNRALMLISGAILAVDMSTGVQTVFSGSGTPDNNTNFDRPRDMVLGPSGDRLLVVDSDLDALVAVDLDTGARSILSDTDPPNDGAELTLDQPGGIALDGDRVLVSNDERVIAVALDDGMRSVFYDSFAGEFGAIAVDAERSRALLWDSSSDSLIGIDLENATSGVISDETTPNSDTPFDSLFDIVVDADNDRALAVERGRVLEVALGGTDDGARQLLMEVDGVDPFGYYPGIAIDDTGSRALLNDLTQPALLEIDLNTDTSAPVFSNAWPDSNNNLRAPNELVLDSVNERILMTDNVNVSVTAVALDDGSRTILSDATTPDGSTPFDAPWGLALDTENNRVLAVDTATHEVIAVDLDTGARTVHSAFPAPAGPGSIAIDHGNNRALVVDLRNGGTIEDVDLSNGVRTVLSDQTTPDGDNMFSRPDRIAVDSVGNRALVTDPLLEALIAVDLDTGARSILSDNATPNAQNPFDTPAGVLVDADDNRALIADRGHNAIYAIDLDTGARSVVVQDTGSPAVVTFDPVDMVMGPRSGVLYVADLAYGALAAIDLTTGERVIVSR